MDFFIKLALAAIAGYFILDFIYLLITIVYSTFIIYKLKKEGYDVKVFVNKLQQIQSILEKQK